MTRKILLFVGALFALPAFAVDVKLTWPAVTTYTDGSTIGPESPVTYKLYGANKGQPMQVLIPTTSALTSTRQNVDGNTHCYAVAAVVGGTQSALSDAACITPNTTVSPPSTAAPAKPGGLQAMQVASTTPVTAAAMAPKDSK